MKTIDELINQLSAQETITYAEVLLVLEQAKAALSFYGSLAKTIAIDHKDTNKVTMCLVQLAMDKGKMAEDLGVTTEQLNNITSFKGGTEIGIEK